MTLPAHILSSSIGQSHLNFDSEQSHTDETPFDSVVLSGGGCRGLVQLGVLHYYWERGIFKPELIKEYVGTSIGAVICLLLNCGYLPMEIFTEIYRMGDFFSIRDCHSPWDVIKFMGLMSINSFTDKIEKLVVRKLGSVPTLSSLYESTGKVLHISAANITQQIEERYAHDTRPHLSVINAIKISCNLPLVFQRIRYNSSYVADGGLINNFAWDYLKLPDPRRVLGIVVMGSDFSIPEDTFMGYFYRLMTLPMFALTELRCEAARTALRDKIDLLQVVWTDAPLLQFSMSSESKMSMFLAGHQAAAKEVEKILLDVKGWTWNFSSEMQDEITIDWEDKESWPEDWKFEESSLSPEDHSSEDPSEGDWEDSDIVIPDT